LWSSERSGTVVASNRRHRLSRIDPEENYEATPMRILATTYRAKHPTGFSAYVGLQAALMQRYLRRGGTIQQWCARLAPAFRQRYAPELLAESGTEPDVRPSRGWRSPAPARPAAMPGAGRVRSLPAAGSGVEQVQPLPEVVQGRPIPF
jgi:hypothetical protein